MIESEPSPGSPPLVSVCVPTYNAAAFLSEGLGSILKQTYPCLEILVGDDGSTDETPTIVRAFADPRIRYYRNTTNLGQFANVNELVGRAAGRYVAVYHSDDIYEPEIVEREVAFLEAHPEAGAVFALDRRIDGEGRLLGETSLPVPLRSLGCLAFPDVMRTLLRHRNVVFRAPSFMIRADVLRMVGPFTTEFECAGDLEMWLRILARFNIGVIEEHLWRYRHTAGQVSSRYNRLRTAQEDSFDVIDRYLAAEGARPAKDPVSLIEYAFHRADDQTFRAANWIIKGNTEEARLLLRQPFPWRTFRHSIRRRKLRVVALRLAMKAALAAGAGRPLARLLIWSEYGGRL